MRILLVEDETKLASSLKKALEASAFAVDLAPTAAAAEAAATAEDYDIIVLDLGLPDRDGLALSRTLRQEDVTAPILMLTARDATQDKVAGFESGADDYLVKPFELEELLARLKAMIRRRSGPAPLTHQLDSLTLDLTARAVTRAGQQLKLTAKEYALLEYLVLNAGRTVSRQELVDHVWDRDLDPFSNTIDVYMGYLRQKLDRDFPDETPLITTIRGLGYKLGP